jgi:hypothetical protein
MAATPISSTTTLGPPGDRAMSVTKAVGLEDFRLRGHWTTKEVELETNIETRSSRAKQCKFYVFDLA